MNCLHVHVSVEGLAQSTRFYSTLFAAEPTVKWMLDDPQGVPWETFLTCGESTVYGEGSLAKLKEVSEAACYAPTCCKPEAIQVAPQPAAPSACCAR